jgi:hypothetical protein
MKTSSVISIWDSLNFKQCLSWLKSQTYIQSCDGTRLSLLFIEIFILALVVHNEHSICSTFGYPLQRHGDTWWLSLIDVDVIGHTCGSRRFAPRDHLWLTIISWAAEPDRARMPYSRQGCWYMLLYIRLQECNLGSALMMKCVVSHHTLSYLVESVYAGSWDAAGSLTIKNQVGLCVKLDVNACGNECNHAV